MTAELLSRIQFGLTASFHYIYPPISMGLGLMLVIIGIKYVRTRDPIWRRLSFFWIRIYGLVFALGIATGVVQEFEFGMNWANYSRFVGNIFGSLLAAEGIFAFFLEGGFLGLMLFGGNRIGPRLWLFATSAVALGAHFSALWIVMANSWMQTPAGYVLAESTAYGQQALMTNFAQVIFTPSFLSRISHVLVSAWIVGASLMLSVSAWYILRKKHEEVARANFKLVLPFFIVFSFVQLAFLGPESAINVTENQPVKLAAMEGLWETESCAPLYIVGWVDTEAQQTRGLSVPCMLSFLAHQDFNAEVAGLNEVTPDLHPVVNLVFQAYHIMINLGVALVGIGLLGAVYYFWGRRLFETKWVLWIFVISIFLTELATLSGWWTAEFGRQPWIVYELLRTADAVSPGVTATQVLTSLIIFIILYIILFILFIFLLNEKIQHGPAPLSDVEEVNVDDLPDTFRELFRSGRQHLA